MVRNIKLGYLSANGQLRLVLGFPEKLRFMVVNKKKKKVLD